MPSTRALRRCRLVWLAGFCAGAIWPVRAGATGLGNLTYTQAELEKPIANFGGEGPDKWATGPAGSNTVMMLRDVMLVMASNDSGAANGSFHVYDVKNPRQPKLLKTFDGIAETEHVRELHAMPVAMIDGKDILVVPTTTGLQFFDFTDPLSPAPSGNITLSGDKGGDYDNTTWMVSWAWPYVYAGSTGSGVYIVDATDPAKPSLVTKIATGELGNFRVGPTYAAGNFMIVANMDQGTTHFSVLDAGDPQQPFLLATGTTPASLYSTLVVGDRIYGAGTNGNYAFLKWSDSSVTPLASGKSGADRGGYCTYQSGFAFCGQSSEGYKKWDTRDENAPKLVGQGTDPEAHGGDFDFATVLGNLVYLGNDHGSGAALVPHSMSPDEVAPEVVKVYPSNGDVKQPLTSRITIFFSEDIDLAAVSAESILVHQAGEATPLPGVFSRSSFNAISFGAKQPLLENTTYEVVVRQGGVKDLVGNVISAETKIRFSTGATVDAPIADPGGSGGSPGGGASSSGGTTSMSSGGSSGSPASGGQSGTGATAGTTVTSGAPSLAGSGGSLTGGASANAEAASGNAGCACSLPGRSASRLALPLTLAAIAALRGRLRRRPRRAA